MSCIHCNDTQFEIEIDKSDPSGVWHERRVPCRCTRILCPSWPWFLLFILALLIGISPAICEVAR